MRNLFLRSTIFLIAFSITLNLFALVFSSSAYVVGHTISEQSFTSPTSTVYDIIEDDEAFYIGGAFDIIANRFGASSKLDLATGEEDLSHIAIGSNIIDAVSDGEGGWYIAGSFLKVGTETRNRLARILPNGELDPDWNPDANNTVNSLSLDGDSIYLGGSFTTIGGQSINRVARVDSETGELDTSWNPNVANNAVQDILKVSDDIYLSGTFTSVDGQTRNRIAKVDALDGSVDLSWNPDANGVVGTLFSADGSLYLGGSFTTIGGVSRSRLAKVSLLTGALDNDWNPAPNNTVLEIYISGDDIYTVGLFSTIGGQTRNRIARLNTTNGNADASWDPNANSTVITIYPYGDYVYVGGSFTTVGGQTANRFARVDNITGALTSFGNGYAADVNKIGIYGEDLYVFGSFSYTGSTVKSKLFKMNKTTGLYDSGWSTTLTSGIRHVFDISMYEDQLYLGGSFITVNGTTRNRLARVDASTGALDLTWDPNVNSNVESFAISGDYNYLGGWFSTIGGQSIGRLGRVNLTGATVDTGWNPAADNTIREVIVDGDYLYVGGDFTSISGQAMTRLARYDLDSLALDTSWNPVVNNSVYTLLAHGDHIYIGGSFTTVDGEAHTGIARISKSTGEVDSSWTPAASAVFAFGILENHLYIGGSFTTVNGESRSRIARLEIATGDLDTGWDFSTDSGTIERILTNETTGDIWFGGTFTSLLGDIKYQNLAHLEGVFYYQILNLDSDLDIYELDSGLDVGETSTFGVYPASSAILRLQKGALIIADLDVDMRDDRDWSMLNADISDTTFESYLHDFATLPGENTDYSLYIPYRQDDEDVGICPGANSFSDINNNCSDLYYLNETNSNASLVEVSGTDYWKVSGLTGTGGFSSVCNQIENIDEGMSVSIDHQDASQGAAYCFSSTQEVLIEVAGYRLADLEINMNNDIDFGEVFGAISIEENKSVVHGLVNTQGTAEEYSLYVPKREESVGVMICPGAKNLAQVTLTCRDGEFLNENDKNVTVYNDDGQSYWKISGLTGTGGIDVLDNELLPGTGNELLIRSMIGVVLVLMGYVTNSLKTLNQFTERVQESTKN